MTLIGVSTSTGLSVTGGTSGHGGAFVGQGAGQYGLVAYGGTAATNNNFFTVPYLDLTGAPTPGTTTLNEAIGALTGRFYNKVTQTSSTQTIFKTDSTTTAATCATSDNGTTQIKGKCN